MKYTYLLDKKRTAIYMRLFVLVTAFFLATNAVGQPVQRIKELLKDRDFRVLERYVGEHKNSFSWKRLRPIVGDYKEGIVEIEEFVPANNGTGENSINNYRVYLLANNDKLFYYKFIKVVSRKNSIGEWVQYEETQDNLTDRNEFLLFEKQFKEIYGGTLNRSDLFVTSIVYGTNCGLGQENPQYMDELYTALQNRNVVLLRKWLISANAEKQLYALLGFEILCKIGYSPGREQKKLISIVKQKEGNVSTCDGCIYLQKTFQSAVSDLNSEANQCLKQNGLTILAPPICWALVILDAFIVIVVWIILKAKSVIEYKKAGFNNK